jgi:hypothetical protein
MLCYQQQDDFLLSMTLRTLDYRKIPSRFLEPQRRTYRRPANNRRISGGASGAGPRSQAKLLTKDEGAADRQQHWKANMDSDSDPSHVVRAEAGIAYSADKSCLTRAVSMHC